ncbi:hypothetical protein [Mesorhizobium sp.]|uniref:hypothetical protein n=1 Tax=Mesorhizobium sp. TaxID=1871066 RepID=UPI000FE38A8D|nr:hypothetical protein [Mesorhizobium sp.]RWN55625.1 MAG: hypothetical protein EOR98_12565 [Mesorhizobium sp.]RWN77224.1 MAG: hypothetical protein EOS02_11930 [Mesorhizobium sp.]RWN80237.1 MAG: hypothetical protein EOS01_12630 [Mesorhizobium sp.]RWN86150.1 MAG: hypothetical protein EOS04_19895 [Mesorhizobium sp.]RWO14960.1 MAG: hypothetical protein EOS15_11705 [Mesorhizobium sp.]
MEAFADYAIDLAKLSGVLLLAELIPSSYSIFRQQEDPSFEKDVAAFVLLLVIVVPLVVVGLHSVEFFSSFSVFIVIHAACVVLQRYLDARFQAQGRLSSFVALPLTSSLVRLGVLCIIGLFFSDIAPNDVAWGATATGSVCSQIIFLARHPAEAAVFLRRGHGIALVRLWKQRGRYVGYYPNVVLKRLRDMAMPLVCDWLVPSKVEAGKYLLAYRGVDFALAQLRVVEALLSNVGVRKVLAAGRARFLVLLAITGQIAAVASSFALAGQAGFDGHTLFLALLASFFVYPYVVELAFRSDAYAAFTPRRVTASLVAFLLGIAVAVSCAAFFSELSAIHLMAAPLLGQTMATLSYWMPIKSARH